MERRGSLARAIGEIEGSAFRIFQHSLLKNIKKNEGGLLVTTFPKKSHNAEQKLKGISLRVFNIHSVAKHQKKLKGDPLGKNDRKKSLTAEKSEKGDPLVSPGIVCYAEKVEKLFWLRSLGQMVQFDIIKFR